jgi:hypothetical protein
MPAQERLLSSLSAHPTLLFPDTDKGLGPCAITYDQYIEDCLKNLTNTDNINDFLSKKPTLK